MSTLIAIIQDRLTDIEDISVAGKAPGYRLTDTDGVAWVLTASTASLSSTVKAVKDQASLRWVKATGGGIVETISTTMGGGISVDNTDPANPVITNSGVLSVAVAGNLSRSAGTGDITLTGPDTGTLLAPTLPAQDIDISGLNGDADGGYEIEGTIVTATNAGLLSFSLQPNNLTTNQAVTASGGIGNGGNTFSGFTVASLFLINVETTAGGARFFTITFRLRFGAKTGRPRVLTGSIKGIDSASTARQHYSFTGEWTDTATNITSLRLHCDVAGGFASGTKIAWRRIGFKA